MLNGFIERVPYIVAAFIVFIIFYFIAKGARAAMRAFARRGKRHYNLGLVLGRLSSGLIIFIGLLVALVIAIPGFTPGQLVNVLGISSVAVGFAFRDILRNFLAGILLLLAEPSLLFFQGRFLHKVMKCEPVTESEVRSAARSQGRAGLAEARAIILETDGSMTVIKGDSEVEMPTLKGISRPHETSADINRAGGDQSDNN